MSWIVRDVWTILESRKEEYATLLEQDKIRAFEIINRLAYEAGHPYGVLVQLNFPPGRSSPSLSGLGHRDLSIIVHRGRESFDPVPETQIKESFKQLSPLRFEPANRGKDGFKAQLSEGRIDCLPSGVHLWCEITPGILNVLDWLFINAYELKPP